MIGITNGSAPSCTSVLDPDPVTLLVKVLPLSKLDAVHGCPGRLEVSVRPSFFDVLDFSFSSPFWTELDCHRSDPSLYATTVAVVQVGKF